MIVCNLATYPPRRSGLEKVVSVIAPQVDQLNVVLNEYQTIPFELARWSNVVPIIPPTDLKDLGKFLPSVAGADYVFLIDDDIGYPSSYVSTTIDFCERLVDPRFIAGYHGTLYRRSPLSPVLQVMRHVSGRVSPASAGKRRVLHFNRGLARPTIVDQLGSGVVVLRGRDMPPFDFMAGSERFVDVRLARWCFENKIAPICLPRPDGWLPADRFDETIYGTFTKHNPPQVAGEIRQFGGRVHGRGSMVHMRVAAGGMLRAA